MDKRDFYYDLPEELIAQTPIARREQSRLLCMDRGSGKVTHRRFYELPQMLRECDCLVLNDSRVIPARLLGKRETGGAAEVLLLSSKTDTKPSEAQPTTTWECLVRPGKKIKPGTKLIFGDNELTAEVISEVEGGNRLIRFKCHDNADFTTTLEKLGKTPLPPYIHEELEDSERYQTVYSKTAGSAAAPTAGLHFTEELLNEAAARGVDVRFITLHVGLGTFRPVKENEIERHKMHEEYFIVPEETAEAVNRAKAAGGRVIAVGTTSCRSIESCTDEKGILQPFSGFTGIFIYPGYKFKCMDGLITNFHLPESTLLMLVSAFAGRENILSAYNEAIKERYRFFSFGDAMLIS